MIDKLSRSVRTILVSIHPQHVASILDGRKTVELRRRFTGLPNKGATVFIYSTSPVKAVVGKARIKVVRRLSLRALWHAHGRAACISKPDFDKYFHGLNNGFAILLENVQPLSGEWKAQELRSTLGVLPPQSYRYLTEEHCALLNDDRSKNPGRHQRHNRP